MLLDADFLIVELNPAAENLLQVSREHARRQPLRRYFHDTEALDDLLGRAQTFAQPYAREILLRQQGDQREPLYIDCRIAPYAGDIPGGMLVEFSDITSRLRISRDNTLRTQHDVGRMIIRQLAHEIKNPLGGLRGAAQLLARKIESPELIEYTDVIIGEVDRLANLVDSLLGPGGVSNKQPVNIHDVLEHVVRIVRADVGDRLRFARDYDPSLPLMHLDRDQMIQAVLNIVRNAATATAPGVGTISLRTRALTNETIGAIRHRVIASIDIEDDGPGIDPGIRDSIFYPLVTGRADGTGIGLPLSQELINRHDGLIEFYSEPGRTVFKIRLPLAGEP